MNGYVRGVESIYVYQDWEQILDYFPVSEPRVWTLESQPGHAAAPSVLA
jgi:hypothetical protein